MAERGLDQYRLPDQRRRDREEEKEIDTQIEELGVNERKWKGAKCNSCLRGDSSWFKSSEKERDKRLASGERPWYERVAVFMCFVCQIYVCADCMENHIWHEGLKIRRKESWRQGRDESEGMGKQNKREGKLGKRLGKAAMEMRLEAESESREKETIMEEKERERMRRKYINKIMNESEVDRMEKFYCRQAVISDRATVKHELDQQDCSITGLCGLENKRWVVCDSLNFCIKIFKVGSNVLQRYIRFVGSRPCAVTEIHLKQHSAEPSFVSGSNTDISATERADPHKQCLVAVTLIRKRQILFIDLSKSPAKIQKTIKTEKECFDIQFYNDNIFTACRGGPHGTFWSVYIKSTDGDTLNKFNIGIFLPGLAVVSGRVYLTDWDNQCVQNRTVEGQEIKHITIEGSRPAGICVNPDNNVYVCAPGHDKVYNLDADLTRYKSVLDQTAGYVEEPNALCYYRDKLFVSHNYDPASSRNAVTVIQLL